MDFVYLRRSLWCKIFDTFTSHLNSVNWWHGLQTEYMPECTQFTYAFQIVFRGDIRGPIVYCCYSRTWLFLITRVVALELISNIRSAQNEQVISIM